MTSDSFYKLANTQLEPIAEALDLKLLIKAIEEYNEILDGEGGFAPRFCAPSNACRQFKNRVRDRLHFCNASYRATND
jgi:hypothetical protein